MLIGGPKMSKKKTVTSENQSAISSTNDSLGAKNGYQKRGNAGKDAAENGTRNKN